MRTIFIFILVLLTAGLGWAQALHLSGRLTASETEMVECYFQFSQDVVIATRPDSEACKVLRQMVGKEVNLSVF